MSLRDEIARELNGSEYPLSISKGLSERAKAGGVVIVYGSSDDLIEFDGAIYDEAGAYEGGTFYIDAKGLLDRSQIEDGDDEAIADFVNRKKTARSIEAHWLADGRYSWTYTTDIPHATFEIVDDGEPYCRGIVFNLSDL